MTQEDDCICWVTLDNQTENTVVVGLSKFDGFIASAPENVIVDLQLT
jgi:hypothetical protein